jgi:hypothetical protein
MRRDRAVHISHAHSHRDQGEHVRTAKLDGRPAAREEGPAAPQHHRCRQRKLDPGCQSRREHVHQRAHAQHGQRHQRNAQQHARPEAPRHLAQLRIFFLGRRRGHRLQRHAADWARTRTVAHNLGMHRAGPLRLARRDGDVALQRHTALRTGSRMVLADLGIHGTDVGTALFAFRCAPFAGDKRWFARPFSLRRRRLVLFRIGFELLATSARAEIIALVAVGDRRCGLGRINTHAANWIFLQLVGRSGRRRCAADLHHARHAGRPVRGRKIFLRIALELLRAAARAEVIHLALVFG